MQDKIRTVTQVLILSQELASLGLSSTCIEATAPGGAGLNTVPALNAMYELLQIHRRSMCTLEELEREQLKKSSTLEHIQMNNSRLKVSSPFSIVHSILFYISICATSLCSLWSFISLQDQLELSIREKSGLHETERQLQLKIKTLQSCLKTEKDEVD